MKRELFRRNLKAEGLEISHVVTDLENGLKVKFDLVTAGDKCLKTYAEILQIRMPLKIDETVESLEKIQPKHGFDILAWLHHMLKKNCPGLMKVFTPSLPSLKVGYVN